MNKILLNAIKEKIQQVGSVSLKLSGHSMYPTIKNGDLITIEACKFEDVGINDIIACYFSNSEHFVIHRVVGIENINSKRVLLTKGDNNNYIDARAVKQCNFVGKVKIKNQIDDVYQLTPNTVYIRNRNCVIQCDDTIIYPPDGILPPVEHRTIKRINRALTTELIILLSYRCNLNCIYCSGNSNSNIDVTVKADNIVKAINFVINNALILRKIKGNDSAKPARIIISGGGEPTVEWKLLTLAVDTVSSLRAKYGKEIAELIILTNAQINDDKADYLIHNFDQICISCDGISVQDKQRPRLDGDSSKKHAINFLDKLNRCNKEVSIRMTVTGEALPYLQDDVDHFFKTYKVIKNIVIEPFVQVGRGTDKNIKKLDYNDFIDRFDAIVRKYYHNVYNSTTLLEYANSYPCHRLAGISLVISPYNVITCCDSVTPESELWKTMIVGSLDGNQIEIIKNYEHTVPDKCACCIALDFCAGGCPIQLNSLSDNEKMEFCNYKKEMVRRELLRRLEFSKKTKKIKFNGVNYSVYTLPRGIL